MLLSAFDILFALPLVDRFSGLDKVGCARQWQRQQQTNFTPKTLPLLAIE
jgi:hypothetical protein